MTAIEFVKRFGWGEFKELYQASLYIDPFRPPNDKIIGIKKSEIKELFEAFELVEKVGGLSKSKEILENKPKGASKYGIGGWYLKLARYVYEYNIHQKIWMQNGKHKEYSGRWESSDYLSDIKKSINLVEQCQ